ncbi:MAG: response regulator, partial [Oligoflexales bacterium]|nr:response regulator [Oligoflexales bacterium]
IMKVNDRDIDDPGIKRIFINGQVDALEKIVFNYLSNALKYVKDEGTIILRLQQVEDKAVISVTDDGIGISKENQKRLFKLFSQVEDFAPKSHEGTGIGLALTKELAEKMNGEVDVISTPGAGSSFLATFPVLKIEKPSIGLAIVTDDQRFHIDLNEKLAAKPEVFSVKSFIDLLELKSVCSEYGIHILITDDTMLGKYGNRALSEIKHLNPGLEVFLLLSAGEKDPSTEFGIMGTGVREFSFPWEVDKIADEVSRKFAGVNAICKKPEGGVSEKKDWFLGDIEDSAGKKEETRADDVAAGSCDPSGVHILIVDDNIDMLHLISGYLNEAKYGVTSALNGKQAIRKCRDLRPDLIISDWMMPVMSGPEFVQYLKNDRLLSSVPVIMLTARSDEASRRESAHFGADAFLGKPFDQIELVSLVQNLLKLKQGEKQIASLNREIADGVLRRFLPPAMIESILNGEAVFDKKPRNTKITILIATLIGFRERIAEFCPDDISEILNGFYTEMTKIIFSHSGVIDRLEDGSIRALFGVSDTDPPNVQVETASRSALEMEKRLLQIIPEWNRRLEENMSYKIVIHHGDAVVGTVGSPLRTDYTAIGAAIHFTKHIEGLAGEGEILVSKDARDYLRPDMWVRHDLPGVERGEKVPRLARVVEPQGNGKKAG